MAKGNNNISREACKEFCARTGYLKYGKRNAFHHPERGIVGYTIPSKTIGTMRQFEKDWSGVFIDGFGFIDATLFTEEIPGQWRPDGTKTFNVKFDPSNAVPL